MLVKIYSVNSKPWMLYEVGNLLHVTVTVSCYIRTSKEKLYREHAAALQNIKKNTARSKVVHFSIKQTFFVFRRAYGKFKPVG